ncbi:GtrA family protein [Phenylobacterium sp.]|uniref:GtrA family protein n=1 Tax=Phenylobacterium sp. TaxID=1871053 RepID=UPI00391C1A81
MSVRLVARQGLVFGLVGVAATLTHVAAAFGARATFDASAMAANFVGYVCAVGVSYLGNARLTFGQPALSGTRFARFLVVSLAGLGANQAITWLLVERLGWPFRWGLAVVVVVVPLLSFAAARLWAFRDRASGQANGPS